MKKIQKKPQPVHQSINRNILFSKDMVFFIAFLIGLGMSLIFSFIVSSYDATTTDAEKTTLLLNPTYLILTISGLMGGLLYSFLLDGALELPGWNKQEDAFKPGFLGEILVGISGAFIAYAVTYDALIKPSTGDPKGVIIFAIGLVGGYGGKAILDNALDRVLKRIKDADFAKEQAEKEAKFLESRKSTLDLVNRQIQEGLNSSEVMELQRQLEEATPEIRQRAFTHARDARRLGRRSAMYKDRAKRALPILDALIISEPNNADFHAQRAFADIDIDPPALDDAVIQLNQAIQLRGPSIQGNTWEYEFHRAIANILGIQNQGVKASENPLLSANILNDLLTVNQTKGLKSAIDEYRAEGVEYPIEKWLHSNQDWVKQQPNGQALLEQFKFAPATQAIEPTSTVAATSSTTPSIATVAPSSPQPTNASVPFAKNGSARDAIDQLKSVSPLTTASTSILKTPTPTTHSTRSSAIATDDLVIAPPNTIIKATTKTYLKKHPIESSQLSYNEKKEVLVGQEYKVLKYSEAARILQSSPSTQIVQAQSSQIPQSGIELIKEFEGYERKLSDGRVQAYPDPGPKGWNLPTIGYGTTVYPDGRTVKRGDIITKAQAEAYLIDHVDKKCRRALERIPTWNQMNDNQRGALYSFAYNLGEGFYRGSSFTSITKVCDSPQLWTDRAWIEQQFVKYNKSNGRTMDGLTRRRKAEAKLFCTPLSTTTVNNENKVLQSSEAMNGHCLVELDYGQGSWYIWPTHWDLPWEDHKEYQETHSEFSTISKQSFGNLQLDNDLASRIIKYMKTKGYQVFTNPREYNIVYVEGMNPNGTLNEDRPNCFNDVRMVIEFTNNKPKIVGCWEATTEPGDKYTYSPQNPKGAARIKFGQYQAWIVAWHPMPKSAKSHEALFQTQPIEVYRDSNKDFQRTGDRVEKGIFGINQHWGYDLPKDSIGGASAGCLVGRTKQGHKEFMALLKQDKRYLADRRYVFYTTVIPGDDFDKFGKS